MSEVSYEPEVLMAEACAAAGHSDFGSDDFREPLRVLCETYDRSPFDESGRKRNRRRVVGLLAGRLRVQAALSCIRLGAEDSSPPVEPPVEVGNLVSRRLIGTPDFDLERVDAREDGEAFSVVTDDRPEVWMILDGRARIRTEDAESVDVRRGATVLIPARIHGAAAALAGGASVLRITLPSPIRGLMA